MVVENTDIFAKIVSPQRINRQSRINLRSFAETLDDADKDYLKGFLGVQRIWQPLWQRTFRESILCTNTLCTPLRIIPLLQMCNITYELNSNDFATKSVPTEASHLTARKMLERITGTPFGGNTSNSTDQKQRSTTIIGLGVSRIKKDQGSGTPDTWKDTKKRLRLRRMQTKPWQIRRPVTFEGRNTDVKCLWETTNQAGSHIFPSSQNLKKRRVDIAVLRISDSPFLILRNSYRQSRGRFISVTKSWMILLELKIDTLINDVQWNENKPRTPHHGSLSAFMKTNLPLAIGILQGLDTYWSDNPKQTKQPFTHWTNLPMTKLLSLYKNLHRRSNIFKALEVINSTWTSLYYQIQNPQFKSKH